MIDTIPTKRSIAYKLIIGAVLKGTPTLDNDKFSFLELGNRKIKRVNVVANIIEKYESEGEKRYSSITLDDASGQIKIKAFGEDTKKLKELNEGDTIMVIGLLKQYNNEVYIIPEIIKKKEPVYLLLRKLETGEENIQTVAPAVNIEAKKLKDEIITMIKNSEAEQGIDTDKIIMSLKSSSPQIINQEIKKLLEDGRIYESRPGRLRFLGE